MKRHPTVTIYTTNRFGSCIDEELNDIECHIFVVACIVKQRPPFIASSTGGVWKIFEKASNYSLIDSFIQARNTEEIIIAHIIILFRLEPVPLNYFSYAVL